MLNQRLLDETELRPVTSLVFECQLWQYGHVACFLLIGLFLYETTLTGGDQGNTHITHGWGNLIDPTEWGLKWKG